MLETQNLFSSTTLCFCPKRFEVPVYIQLQSNHANGRQMQRACAPRRQRVRVLTAHKYLYVHGYLAHEKTPPPLQGYLAQMKPGLCKRLLCFLIMLLICLETNTPPAIAWLNQLLPFAQTTVRSRPGFARLKFRDCRRGVLLGGNKL